MILKIYVLCFTKDQTIISLTITAIRLHKDIPANFLTSNTYIIQDDIDTENTVENKTKHIS